ncbi:MAG: nucleotidyltransferase family protein [Lachnospiraceae bacterium]|nr:nucleotidyltransferase family protein [Lachnospiraceae bacterium]
MKCAAIIAEFNPFHNGHKYIIEEVKKRTGADRIIIIMSGDFVQSGKPAIIPKEARTRQALLGGADLVIMIPTIAATASSEFFAFGAVSVLKSLGVVDYLGFGAETDNLELLETAADIFSQEPEEYKASLRTYLKQGCSFPIARQKALKDMGADATFLSGSNNLLAIEYLRALKYFGSDIKPVVICRKSVSHMDTVVKAEGFASATAIRNSVFAGELSQLSELMPEEAYDILSREAIMNPDCLVNIYASRLFSSAEEELNTCSDSTEELTRHLLKCVVTANTDSYDNFVRTLQPKNITFSRLSRFLCHVMLDISSETVRLYKEHNYPSYVRILGFKKDASDILSAIKDKSSIPLISKPSSGKKIISEFYDDNMAPLIEEIFDMDLRCGNLHRFLSHLQAGTTYISEEQKQTIII